MKPPIKMEFSAGGVIFNPEGKILMILVQDQSGNWTFPKGTIEKGETPERAALREVKEEVGLNAEIVTELQKTDHWYIDKWSKEHAKVHKTVYWYLMKAAGDPTPQKSEINDARWFETRELQTIQTYKNTNELIQEAIQYIQKNHKGP